MWPGWELRAARGRCDRPRSLRVIPPYTVKEAQTALQAILVNV